MTDLDAVLDRLEATEVQVIEPAPDALVLLQQVYRCTSMPLPVRMRAAMAALPFERPKLAVIAQLGSGFANSMEAKLRERIERRRMAEPRVVIEAKPAEPLPVKPMTTSIPDRRMRRF
jgi:hypothetical protein